MAAVPSIDDRVEELARALEAKGLVVGTKPWRRVHAPAAAYVLGITVKTLRNRTAQRQEPAPYKLCGTVQWELADLIHYVDRCKKAA